MASTELDHDENCIKETYANQSFSTGTPDIGDMFRDPQISPRVGEEYQAEIPPLMNESDHQHLFPNHTKSEAMVGDFDPIVIGLPIPIMWVHDRVTEFEVEGNVKGSVENSKGKKGVLKLKKKDSGYHFVHLNTDLYGEMDSNALKRVHKNKGKCPFPGSLGNAWNDIEVQSFVLGLYIFGKNFVQIRRFMEKKEMGDILSFYYGVFYRSAAYLRWSGCKKPGSRKGATGRRIFTGWRQQEILSRLLPHVPEEFQKTLLEDSMSFEDGKTSLEEYILSIKSTVSIPILLEAVGIGKGKEDLTVLTTEPRKNNDGFSLCPITPSGKYCSSLTCGDVVKFLTGDFHLSKARHNDIFWEAVWPRLLVRGWHSEKPRNQGYVNSKHSLIFLVPGVKKFSRRELVKGEHYFDSVSDVLSKVASEPELLELEAEKTKDPNDDLSDQQHCCYLKPHVSAMNPTAKMFTIVDTSLAHRGKLSGLRFLPVKLKATSKGGNCTKHNKGSVLENLRDVYKPTAAEIPANCEKHKKNNGPYSMKFSVVDTSLDHGGKSSKMRELRCFPVEYSYKSICLQKANEGNSLQRSPSKRGLDTANVPFKCEKNTDNFKCCIDMNHTDQKALGNNSDAANKVAETNRVQKLNRMTIKHQFSRRVKSSRSDFIGPLVKRRRLIACAEAETSSITVSDAANKAAETDRVQKLNGLTIKHQFIRRVKSSRSDFIGPLAKRRRLTACAKAETSSIKECFSEGVESGNMRFRMTFSRTNKDDNVVSQTDPHLKESSTVKEESSQNNPNENCFGMDMHYIKKDNKDEPESLIDLNLPQMPLDCKNINVEDKENVKSLTPEESKNSIDIDSAEQHPNMNFRRQSMRNRPLTVKALEAFENGLLYDRRKQKWSKEKPFLNSSRKAHRRVKGSSNRSSDDACISQLKVEN